MQLSPSGVTGIYDIIIIDKKTGEVKQELKNIKNRIILENFHLFEKFESTQCALVADDVSIKPRTHKEYFKAVVWPKRLKDGESLVMPEDWALSKPQYAVSQIRLLEKTIDGTNYDVYEVTKAYKMNTGNISGTFNSVMAGITRYHEFENINVDDEREYHFNSLVPFPSRSHEIPAWFNETGFGPRYERQQFMFTNLGRDLIDNDMPRAKPKMVAFEPYSQARLTDAMGEPVTLRFDSDIEEMLVSHTVYVWVQTSNLPTGRVRIDNSWHDWSIKSYRPKYFSSASRANFVNEVKDNKVERFYTWMYPHTEDWTRPHNPRYLTAELEIIQTGFRFVFNPPYQKPLDLDLTVTARWYTKEGNNHVDRSDPGWKIIFND